MTFLFCKLESHVNTATGTLLQFPISLLKIPYQKRIMSCINEHRTIEPRQNSHGNIDFIVD